VLPAIDLARHAGIRRSPERRLNMDDDTLLMTIDDALGASTVCSCGKELRAAVRDDTLWLECPVFAGPSRLPSRLMAFLCDSAHDRRPVGALRPTPAPISVATTVAVSAARPVAAHG
jgi:hypothetical protein